MTDTKREPSSRRVAKDLNLEVLAAIQAHMVTSTQIMARLGGLIFNDVLDGFTDTFGADPCIQRSWGVAAGAVTVDNLSAANTVTVVAGGRSSGGVPDRGLGVYKVPAGQRRTFTMTARELTLWGTEDDQVSVQVYTAPIRPSS